MLNWKYSSRRTPLDTSTWLEITGHVYSHLPNQLMEMPPNSLPMTIRNKLAFWHLIATHCTFSGSAHQLFYSLLSVDCSFCISECRNVQLPVNYICQRDVLQLGVGEEKQNQTKKKGVHYFTSRSFAVGSHKVISMVQRVAAQTHSDVY